jgi:prepilin-type N-terminal cleavage/methylation domain-containing protein
MKRASKKKLNGVSLVELLVVLAVIVILANAIGFAFSAELNLRRMQEARRYKLKDPSVIMQNEITRMLLGAKINPSASDTLTYFTAGTSASNSSVNELGCDRVTFTTTEPGVPYAALASSDDFTTQQNARGPIGGVAEVSLSVTAVGNAGDKTGLFERMQIPSDGDATQGGTECVLDMHVSRIGFQFWDGQEWVSTWDTTTDRRLPEQVKVSYSTTDQPDTVRAFIVSIPTSDIDSLNPDTQQGGATS